jgi:hypothetical protein
MPFDPTVPTQGETLDAGPVRGDFQALYDLIQAIAAVNAAQVDGVTTGNPGDEASASVTVNGQTLHFTFSIPRGADGAPGEVTDATLTAAIAAAVAGTSANSNAVAMLSQYAAPSYDAAQLQALFDKVDELIQALRRP